MEQSATNLMEDSLEFDENFNPLKKGSDDFEPTLSDVKEMETPVVDDLPEEGNIEDSLLVNGNDFLPNGITEETMVQENQFYNDISSISSSEITEQINEAAAIQQEIQRLVANEIFTDGGLDFLEQQGTTPTESELARQSLFLKFDPLVGAAVPANQIHSSQPTNPPSVASSVPAAPVASANPFGLNGIRMNQAFAPPSHADTTNYIAAMQRQQQKMLAQQPTVPKAPEMQMTNGPTPSVNGGPHNGSGDYIIPDTPPSSGVSTAEGHSHISGPPGSLVSLVDTPQRPAALRVKHDIAKNVTQRKMMNRRSVPVGFLDSQMQVFDLNLDEPNSTKSDMMELPELQPVWENVITTYESVVQVLISKLQRYQEEANEAKQRESKALKDQEELHKVFVGLHERFEASKGVIATYKANQDIVQQAYDDLNAEFQPVMQENKKMQAAMRLNDMKVRQLEEELGKKKEEIAELTKIVDDLISKE